MFVITRSFAWTNDLRGSSKSEAIRITKYRKSSDVRPSDAMRVIRSCAGPPFCERSQMARQASVLRGSRHILGEPLDQDFNTASEHGLFDAMYVGARGIVVALGKYFHMYGTTNPGFRTSWITISLSIALG